MQWIFFSLHFFVFALVHSFLAAQKTKTFLFDRFPALSRFYRLLFNLLAVVWTLFLLKQVPHSGIILWSVPWPFTLFPAAIMLWAGIEVVRSVFHLNAWEFAGLAQLRNIKTVDLDAATHRELSTKGWYGRVRHPLYFFSLLFLVSKPTMTLDHAVLTLFSALYFYVGAVREEKLLLEKFGTEFLQWKESVPMWVPRIFSQKH